MFHSGQLCPLQSVLQRYYQARAGPYGPGVVVLYHDSSSVVSHTTIGNAAPLTLRFGCEYVGGCFCVCVCVQVMLAQQRTSIQLVELVNALHAEAASLVSRLTGQPLGQQALLQQPQDQDQQQQRRSSSSSSSKQQEPGGRAELGGRRDQVLTPDQLLAQDR